MKKLGSILICCIFLANIVFASTGQVMTGTQSKTGKNVNNKVKDNNNKKMHSNISKSLSAKLLKNFQKKQKKEIQEIYETEAIGNVLNVEKAKKNLDKLSNEFKDMSADFANIEDRKERVDEKYNQVKETMKSILKNIRKTQNNVNKRLIKIKLYTKRVRKTKSQLEKIKKDMKQTKSYFSKYTNMLYKMNNDFYNDKAKIDDIKLLLKSENIAQTLSYQEIVKALTKKLNSLFKELEKKQKKYKKYTKKVNELRTKYKYQVKEYKKEIKLLKEQKKSVKDLFKYLKTDKEQVDSKYKKIEKNKNDLKEQMKGILKNTKKDLKKAKKEYDFDVKKLLKNGSKKDSSTFFSWPVLPPKKITAFFKDKEYKKKKGTVHKAIDIKAPQKSEVYAPANGVVYKVVENDSVSVNWLIMVHEHGYVTAYLHMNEIHVQKGDFVKRGEIIGLSGGEPGTRGAGLLSSGPHLHFQVVKDGQYIDPLSVMELSPIKDEKKLPKKYHLKYFKDIYSRNTDLSDVKYMKGDSLKKRRERFLSIYAGNGPYSQVSLWKRAARNTNVDVDLGICIGFAETGLGSHFASKWNVGNVGNNDRGQRKDYKSPLRGAKGIYYALSNQYLSDHYRIDKLSRYNNKNGSIYASDPTHWQENIVKCLSRIKGYRVPEDYFFRKYKPHLQS